MANEKDLKKLNAEDKKAVAGGDIYYSKEDWTYYAPNPGMKYNRKLYSIVDNRKNAIEREKKAGRGAHVHYYDTTEEAMNAAVAEAIRIRYNL